MPACRLRSSDGADPADDSTVSITGFDTNRATPYVQNLTLALTRNVGRKITVDVRYVGTFSRKLYGR